MKKTLRKSIAVAMSFWIGFYPVRGAAEDIDIFTGASAGSSDNPNVLIVLDNTSNWARQSQKWPDGASQGQSEVSAIKQVVADLNSEINVGLFEFVTEGAGGDDGGKVRFAVTPMNDANKASMTTTLNTIDGAINDPLEKRNSGVPYGNLMYDVYNYFSGTNALFPSAVTGASRVDANGYTSTYSTFKTPLSSANACAKNYVIFVSNPDASGPSSDTAANTAALAALGGNTTQLGLPNFATSTTTQTTSVGDTAACYSTSDSKAACNAAVAAEFAACGDGTYDSCACGSTVTEAGACAAGTQRYMVKATIAANSQRNLGLTGACYSNTNNCPANSDTTWDTQCSSSTGVTDSSGNAISVTGLTCSCNSSTTVACGNKKYFTVAQAIPSTVTANLGYTSACYASSAACSTGDYAAKCTTLGGWGGTCACDSTNTTTGATSCAAGTSKYTVNGTSTVTVNTPTGTTTADTHPFNADEWARFMYQSGVPVSGATAKQSIATYTIDVYNAQPNATHTALMISMAKAGGGKYFNATNEAALVTALKQIFAEIESVNSTFASASLPVNATNRAQNENQVFIGMFRPDPEAKPRWFGNLKRYQLILGSDGTTVELGDKDGQAAVNNNTGFITDCANSWWTSDSGAYWQQYSVNPSAAGTCTTSTNNTYSDSPDGPRVEKGAVAEVVRKGNNPTATDGSPTFSVNRTIYGTETNASTTLTALSGLATLDTDTKNWVLGHDVIHPTELTDENDNGALKQDNTGTMNTADTSRATIETRATIHGDVIHSRPLPINYGNGVVVYYGANDGMLRAVDAETGKELWGFVPYEFHSRLERLRLNSPLVSYPNVVALGLTSQAKDYFWDGSVGVLQNADNSKVWIYPTMRRGGRMIYAMDVSTATSPSIKWKAGCPNLANDTDCTAGMSGIGQTWSIPNVAPVKGYSTTDYLLFLGGGYDTCEDADTIAPACGSPKGAGVYVLKADDGSVVKSLSTTRSVASDVSVIDINGDGYADYAYVLDTGGSLYRISMVERTVAGDGSVTYDPLAPAAWTIHQVAYTNGSGQGRKFLFAPALLGTTPALGKVYVAMGTGDREHPLATNYPFGAVTNRFYTFLDDLSSTAATNLDDASVMNNVTVDPGCDGSGVLPTGSSKGWFMDLNQYGTGEQTVTSSLIVGGMVTFSTNRPIQAAAGTCSTVLGEARGYWVNLFNGSGAIGVNGSCGGSRSGVMVGGGLPPSPVIGTVPVGGKVTTVVLGAAQKGGGANTPISPQKTKPTISSTRTRVYLYSTGDN